MTQIAGQNFVVAEEGLTLFGQTIEDIAPEETHDEDGNELDSWEESLRTIVDELSERASGFAIVVSHDIALHLFNTGFLDVESFEGCEETASAIRFNFDVAESESEDLLLAQFALIVEKGDELSIDCFLLEDATLDELVEMVLDPVKRSAFVNEDEDE